jgi:hypothetical protein
MTVVNLEWLRDVLGNLGCSLMGCGCAALVLALIATVVGLAYPTMG